MGDVVNLATVRRRIHPARVDRSARLGEIVLFTGVRIERWEDPAGDRTGVETDRRPRTPRRRGGR